MFISKRDYWKKINDSATTVVGLAFDNLVYDCKTPTIENIYDAIFDNVLHEYIDSHEWVIYSVYNLQVLQYSDNAEYMLENLGEDGAIYELREGGLSRLYAALTYWALYGDISDKIDSDFIIETLGDKIKE